MKRRFVVRTQLFLLGAVLVLLLGRVFVFTGDSSKLITLDDLDSRSLSHASFAVHKPVRMSVQATGSFEALPAAGIPGKLAAYGWILNRSARKVVWEMAPETVAHTRGLLAARTDTISLEPGVYDVFFSAYGSGEKPRKSGSFFRRIVGPAVRWQNEHSKWQMALHPVGAFEGVVEKLDESDARERPSEALWSSAPMHDKQRSNFVFEVVRPVQLQAYAVGEWRDGPADHSWIDNVTTGETVWKMDPSNTRPAGGSPVNRLADESIRLEPGIYRAIAETNGRHAFDDWNVGPPYDPLSWGLTLLLSHPQDTLLVRPFDPWAMRTPLVGLTRVPHDNHRTRKFSIRKPVDVMVYAVGEITDTDRYDYGWLENETTGQIVWDMNGARTSSAGGDHKNRLETAFLTLAPGDYALHYRTDDSHNYDDWNSDPPDHPERWGVTLFPVAPSVDSGAFALAGSVNIENTARDWEGPAGALRPPLPPMPIPGNVLVIRNLLRNEEDVREPFELDRDTEVFIRAVGEISMSGRYDYGWIERADTREIVWEMTWQNTTPAGGDERNRMFAGLVRLPAGSYVARFKTDLSHAFKDFGDARPDHPEAWGIVISRP